jgi:hypothetical protein
VKRNPPTRGAIRFAIAPFDGEDADVFTTPWSASVTYGRPLGEWAENVCAENLRKYNTEKEPAVPTANKPDF